MAAGVQSMCQYWKEFNLPELQRTLDTTATEIANKQDESDASRKKLVELSRDFKKNTPEDLRKLVAPLLKNFQLEVDALSKRSKSSEAAFLSVYKRIIDLPDPVSALEHALHIQKRAQRVSDLEIENKQLRETLEEYNNEFAEVKNQEVTIKQLKEKIKDCEEKIEGTAEARTKEKERELQRLFAEKERQLQETQLSVAKKLGEAEQKISILQSSLDHVQQELFDVRSKYDETSTAKSDEMDMVIADLERANERATSAEREAERLKAELTKREEGGKLKSEAVSKTTEEQAMDILQRSSLEVELAAKEKEIAQLVEDVQRLQASLNKLRESTANQVSKLEEELNMKNQAFRLLEQKIKNQEDYEEIKRELSVMKSIEFSKSGDESNGDMQKKSLEMLLLEKNKALQSENTTLKLAKQDLSGKDTPALSESAENFASMLGEEIAASYQQKQQSETNASSRRSTPSTTSSIANDSEKMSSPKRSVERSHSIPPMSSDIHLPPPSPHFFPFPNGPFSAAVNGPLMASYAGLSAVKSETSSSQGLDTSLVAKTVRELLSIHNIGQRLFAKHVLGLSQGTVSELLSKPKSWDKLTEKGRESYRKMYQWATDERNILSLKAISPKKNTQHVMPNITREDSQTEERIAQILSEAQQAMQIKKEVEQVSSLENYHQVASAMASSIYQQEMARLAIVSSHQKHLRSPTSLPSPHHIHSASINAHRRSSHNDRHMADNQMSNKEMVERIYKQELMKLAKAAESAGNVAALSMYQQELSKMSQPSKDDHEPGEITRNTRLPENLSVKKEPAESPMEDLHQSNGPIDLSKHGNSVSAPTTPTSAISDKSPTDSTQPASAFFRPKSAIPENGMESPRFGSYNNNSECISPLQRMQSIANSVMSRPHPGLASNKPLRAVLPPITQEQFDKYANMCTEELVKKVKETLSQYSISQRLFGENVLGLSQGSVSDLLARPKPWQMLTQKGREPFIRMQIFLEDTEAVPKLVASQYHIPPDKLMRNNGNLPNQETGEKAGSCSSSSASAVGGPSVASSHMTSENALQHMSHLHHHHLHPSQPHQAHNPLLSAHHYNWATFSYPSSMLEVVAMTSEIDTLELTSRVKDVLQFHNLGQKLFGEAVLGLSQGSVSELLSKPKPWHMLSIKGREPFIKMHLWLSDPHNVERLKHYQNEVKAQRRRRSSVDERPYDAVSQPKRPRVFFNEEQKEKLKMAYHQDPYPNQSTIEALANQLNVGVKTVINWFHNHRMRAKQQQHSGNSSGGGSTSSFNEFNSNVVKSEPADDSNQSDLSSLSGDVPNYPAGSQYNESGQWLFPTFKKVSSNDKRGSGSDEREFEDMDDEDEGRSEQSFSPVPFEDDKEEEEDEFKKEESLLNGKQDQDSTGEYSDDPGLNNSGRSAAPSQPQIGVNKRKRSNPQYMSEGRQLDKTKTTSYNASVSLDEGVEVDGEDEEDNADLEKENEDMNTRDSNSKVPRVADHLDGLQKIKKVNKSSEEAWEDMDRSSNIAKLQKNLQQQSPNSEWEF